MAIKVLCSAEVGEVLVVIEDLNLVLGSLQYVTPFLQTTDDGKWLFVIDGIVVFHVQEAF